MDMKVLIAVDSSDASKHATQTAHDFFPNAEHIVLSAVVSAPYAYTEPLGGGAFAVIPSIDQMQASEAAADHATSMAKDILGGSTDAVVDIGDPGRAICAEAMQHAVDVIVVGRGDKKWLDRLFQPSVSDHVMKHAPCPVLVVREPSA